MKEVCTRREITYVAIGFILSLLHWSTCFLFFASLLFLLKQEIIGCLKGLLIITTRGILSTAAGAALSGPVGMEKWALVFIFSLYILYSQRLDKDDLKQFYVVNSVQILVWIFAFYTIISSLLTGSFPVTSAFKVISYIIPFTAVIYGVTSTRNSFDWAQYSYALLTPLIIASVFTIPLARFKIVNESFQGVINHPNLFGIFGAIYITFLLYSNFSVRKTGGLDWRRWLFLILTLVMIYLSQSRTGMFSTAAVILTYYLTMNSESKIKLTFGIAVALVFVAVYFVTTEGAYDDFMNQVSDFIYKRETDDILESRLGQIESSDLKYESHKLLGSGFAVPYVPELRYFKLSMDLTYEAGNLFIALLGDTGIFGLILFSVYMLYILFNTKPKKFMLFLAPIVISCGEMAFFATNNIAVYYYVMLAICICLDEEVTENDTQCNSAGLQCGGLPSQMRGQSA